MSTPQHPHFEVLDSWRGISAVLITLFHFDILNHYHGTNFMLHSFVLVDFFFVLSGFIIAANYYKTLNSRGDFQQFLIKRVGRIFPLHLFTFFVVILINGAFYLLSKAGLPDTSDHFGWLFKNEAIITNLLLIHSLGMHDSLTWNFPSWSISTEFYTYLFFAALCLMFRKRMLLVVGLIIPLCLYLIYRKSSAYMDTTYDYGIFRCIAGFLCGYLTFLVYQRVQQRVAGWPMTGLEVLILLASFIYIDRYGGGVYSILAPLFFSLMVLVFAFQRGQISIWLGAKVFRRLGELSYSIYLTHVLIIMVIVRSALMLEERLGWELFATVERGRFTVRALDFGHPLLMDLISLVYILVILLVSAKTYEKVEVPARRYFRDIARRYKR